MSKKIKIKHTIHADPKKIGKVEEVEERLAERLIAGKTAVRVDAPKAAAPAAVAKPADDKK